MTEQTPKRKRQPRQPKPEVTEQPVQTDADKRYVGNTERYRPPENMVPLDKSCAPKERIGKKKAVRGPGTEVSKVGLGGLRVVHQNPIDYYGNLDVRSDTSGQS